jgi:hypothetical protein
MMSTWPKSSVWTNSTQLTETETVKCLLNRQDLWNRPNPAVGKSEGLSLSNNSHVSHKIWNQTFRQTLPNNLRNLISLLPSLSIRSSTTIAPIIKEGRILLPSMKSYKATWTLLWLSNLTTTRALSKNRLCLSTSLIVWLLLRQMNKYRPKSSYSGNRYTKLQNRYISWIRIKISQEKNIIIQQNDKDNFNYCATKRITKFKELM